MIRSFYIRAGCIAAALLVPAAATASETVTYTYDARGRLIEVDRAGTVNDGVSTTYTLDKADNRTNKTTTGTTPPSPSLSIGNASTMEGGNLSFTVTRSGSTVEAVSVDYASVDDTALAGSDYAAVSGTLSFASGETSKSVTVATIDDSDLENNESLTVALSNPSPGVTFSDNTGQGTIRDNDGPTLAISDASGTEGGTLVFTVTKTGPALGVVRVAFETVNGTAVLGSGNDYSRMFGVLAFEINETTKWITVSTQQDSSAEGSEIFGVVLTNPSGGATISDNLGIGTIIDND